MSQKEPRSLSHNTSLGLMTLSDPGLGHCYCGFCSRQPKPRPDPVTLFRTISHAKGGIQSKKQFAVEGNSSTTLSWGRTSKQSLRNDVSASSRWTEVSAEVTVSSVLDVSTLPATKREARAAFRPQDRATLFSCFPASTCRFTQMASHSYGLL